MVIKMSEMEYKSIREEADFPVLIFGPGPRKKLQQCVQEEYSGDVFDAILSNCEKCEFKNDCGFNRRVKIARHLKHGKKGYPVIIELEFLKSKLIEEYAFIDLIEDLIIQNLEVDNPLLIIFPESPGSQTEFNIFYRSPLKNRIRLIVNEEYNPLYTREIGLLGSIYLTFLGEVGYLFVYWSSDQLELLVERIVDADVKKISINSNKFKFIPGKYYKW